jgi:hypothetical protein
MNTLFLGNYLFSFFLVVHLSIGVFNGLTQYFLVMGTVFRHLVFTKTY